MMVEFPPRVAMWFVLIEMTLAGEMSYNIARLAVLGGVMEVSRLVASFWSSLSARWSRAIPLIGTTLGLGRGAGGAALYSPPRVPRLLSVSSLAQSVELSSPSRRVPLLSFSLSRSLASTALVASALAEVLIPIICISRLVPGEIGWGNV